MYKNLIRFFGIIALFSAVGFSFVGCEDPFVGTQFGDPIVTINGTPKLMMKFTASSSPSSNFSGDYTWSYSDNPDYSWSWNTYGIGEECYSGANRSELTIPVETPNLLGKYIRASRHNHITNTTVYSNVIGPIQLADVPAIVLSGTPQLDMKLTAKSDPNFSGDYKWYFASSSNSSSWTEIKKEEVVPSSCFSGTNNFTIPITALDGSSFVGKYIMVKRLHNNVSEIQSNVLGPVQQGNLDGYVIINGTSKAGTKLIATSNSNFSGNYTWSYSDNPNYSWSWNTYGIGEECYSGDSRCEFTIPENLVGKYIRAYRRNHMSNSNVYSNIIGPVQP